ncbi:MAG: LPXTG cell wall anchor domain-containing protein [Anaerovoracaceae bacterium]
MDDAAEVLMLFSALLATSVALLVFLKRRKKMK